VDKVFIFEFALPIALAFLTLSLVNQSLDWFGAYIRRRPNVMNLVGIFIAVSGVIYIGCVDEMAKLADQILLVLKIGTSLDIKATSESAKKIIELAFAANGAGLIILSMDIRTETALNNKKTQLPILLQKVTERVKLFESTIPSDDSHRLRITLTLDKLEGEKLKLEKQIAFYIDKNTRE
jgi:hypothetical protein